MTQVSANPTCKRILVTGGAGFLGSRAVATPVVEAGHDVLCIDN